MEKTISFYTLGCRLNQAETAIIQQGFERQGYRIVGIDQPADIVVINTCTVTENGDADTRRLVNKINRLNAQSKIALVGCQAQIQQEKLLELSGVQWVVGNAVKMDLARMLPDLDGGAPQVIAPVIKKGSFTIPFAGIDPHHTRANLKIQDGCDFFCSFCEIPYARGRARSREFGDLLREARELVSAGHRELVLTGINVGTYRFEDKSILDVISELERIDDLQRIRITSIEPSTIPEMILKKMAGKNKLCRFLHIPLQSGSDPVLQNMNRRYNVKEFADFLTLAEETVPDVCLGTDVIVGFPGETEEHFGQTYDLLRELPFTYFHVFSYSDRQIARSRKHGGKVPKEEIERRSQRLRELSARKRRCYFQRFLGRTESVLFEQNKNGFWSGLTDTYIRVKAKSDLDLRNQFLPVRLEKIDNQTIIGTIQ
jgi:threonylcarbamoyladenosine tRNA methylthiotransferase MtaB